MPPVGLGIPIAAPDAQPDTPLQFGRRAEAAGADSVWMVDRLVFTNQDPLISLAAIAGATSRIKLGNAVLLGLLRSPLLLAKMVASLDQVSNGRAILGLGLGSRANDYEAAGVPFEKRGAQLSEAIRLLRLAWSGQPVKFQGQFHQYDLPPVGPLPVQPSIPMYLGGSAETALRRIGRYGDGYVGSSAGGVETFRANVAKVRRHAAEAGRDPAAIKAVAVVYGCCDDNRDRAAEITSRYLGNYYGPKAANLGPSPNYMLGSADNCVRFVQPFVDAGAELVVLASVTADLAHFETLCQDVLPRVAASAAGQG